MRNTILILSILCVLITTTACQAADVDDPKVREVMKYAPPDAFGVIHIDLLPLREYLKELGEDFFDYEVFPLGLFERKDRYLKERFFCLVNLADSLDYFPIMRDGKWLDFYVLRASSEPKAWKGNVLWILPPNCELKKIRDGQYKAVREEYNDSLVDTGVRIIFGSETDGLGENIVLVGNKDLFTDKFVAHLGKIDNASIYDLLGNVDTSMQGWGAIDFRDIMGTNQNSVDNWTVKALFESMYHEYRPNMFQRYPDHQAPLYIYGGLNLTIPGGRITARFGNDESPRLLVASAYERPLVFPSILFPFSLWSFNVCMSVEPHRQMVRLHGKELTLTLPENSTGLKTYSVLAALANQELLRHISQRNLAGIGVAIYGCLREDVVPPSLKSLTEQGLSIGLNPKALISPMSGRNPDEVKTDENGMPIGPIDYVYIVLPKAAPHNLVQAYEKSENYKGSPWGEGTLVLLRGRYEEPAKIKWMDIKAFQEALDRTRKWLAEHDNK